jgi:hypothetical protein
MLLVDREVLRAPVDLPRAGEDDAELGVVVAARLQDRELAARVDLEVVVGVGHRVQVARLAGEVEEDVLALHEVAKRVDVPHVRDVHRHAVLEPRDVGEVAAVLGDQGVHEQDPCAGLDELPRQRRPDEAEASRDQHPLAAERLVEVGGDHATASRTPATTRSASESVSSG